MPCAHPLVVVALACALASGRSKEFPLVPLAPIAQLMQAATAGNYALGYFESWNLESLQGSIDAAERTRSPTIIGFSGEFLSQRADATPEDLTHYAALGRAAAEKATVPCGFILNECSRDAWVERAITLGFNLVMPADPNASAEDYRHRVTRLTQLAHARNVAVEADFEGEEQQAADTYAKDAAHFVKSTGVDLLAISVGNEEIKLKGRAPLDLARVAAVHEHVPLPLVLHGGTGIEDASLKEAIRLGVRKVNYGTYVKQHYLKVLRAALSISEPNPHALLGDGSHTDIMVIGRKVVCEAVLERIDLLGCSGKA
jgi:fructose/tagatose bisphosphate aldolase